MAENNTSTQSDTPRVETNIVFEAPRQSIGQAIVIWLVRTALGLAIVAGLGYAFLNFTPAGEELKDKYERKSRETVESLEEGLEFCRVYASCMGHPPISHEEVLNFQTERLTRSLPFGKKPPMQLRLPAGKTLSFWNARDGFGHDIDIQVDQQRRTIKLTSPGFFPISGSHPGFFDVTREATY